MPPRKSAARGDKEKSTTKEDPVREKPAESGTSAPAEESEAPTEDLQPESYLYTTFRQHIGFILGALSIFLTYYVWDENDPNSVWRMVGCLGLCTVGLVFHELRPFKRRGYGDVAWERMGTNPSAATIRGAMGG